MKSATRSKPTPRTPRRWRTPPPLTRGSAETLEGMDILRELGGDAGTLLWQSYRNVMFWATAEPEDRASMFSPEAGAKRATEVQEADLPDALREPLATIGRMLSSPADIPGEEIGQACAAIAEWAKGEDAEGSVLSFTQAAALSWTRNAELAYKTGLIARRRGDLARADTWFRQAIMIGRQVGDWTSYSLAYVALGNMMMRRGNYPGAHRMEIKALRAARRKGLARIQGVALHDLYVIAVETGREAQADEYARQALRAYGPDHPKLPILAQDVAYAWLLNGHFARSLGVFQALLPHLAGEIDEIWVHAHIARAAGGVGEKEIFRKAWVEVNRMVRDPLYAGRVAGAMIEIAEGAASLGEWDRAEQAAEKAIAAAREHGEAKIIVRAESLIDSVRSGRTFAAKMQERPATQTSEKGEALAEDLIRSLDATVGAA